MVESKGYLSEEMRRNYIAVAKQNPSWTLIFCFQDGRRRISKRSPTTYDEWARKHGFQVIPLGELHKRL